jgi:hypothetical protein
MGQRFFQILKPCAQSFIAQEYVLLADLLFVVESGTDGVFNLMLLIKHI